MKRFLILLLLVYLFYTSCKKPGFNDLGGTKTLSGVAMLHDNYLANGRYTPLPNITVYLRNKDDVNGYLYSTRTDDKGQFSFTGIDTTRSYRVDASYESGQVYYTGAVDASPTSPLFLDRRDTLLLGVDGSLQNGVHVVVKDYLGGAVPNATVWMFSSPASFVADTSANAAFTLLTDTFGIANKYRVAPGDYYFRVKTRAGTTELVDETKATIGNTGIQPVSLTVQPVPRAGFGNGIDIFVHEINGSALANASLFFYKNYETYVQDSGKYQNSLFKLVSGSGGHASAYLVNPATYFVWGRKVLSTKDTLSSRVQKSIFVTTSIVTDDLPLK